MRPTCAQAQVHSSPNGRREGPRDRSLDSHRLRPAAGKGCSAVLAGPASRTQGGPPARPDTYLKHNSDRKTLDRSRCSSPERLAAVLTPAPPIQSNMPTTKSQIRATQPAHDPRRLLKTLKQRSTTPGRVLAARKGWSSPVNLGGRHQLLLPRHAAPGKRAPRPRRPSRML
mgnify:CR=1 FL=1